jgi:hypothetical protein
MMERLETRASRRHSVLLEDWLSGHHLRFDADVIRAAGERPVIR